MKANELRIGNYYDHYGIVARVTANTIMEVWESQRKWCKPIPLTEEWLLKLGLIKSEHFRGDYDFDTTDGWFVKGINRFEIDNIYIRTEPQMKPIYIKYVHQLQNLYFALTKNELEIKATK